MDYISQNWAFISFLSAEVVIFAMLTMVMRMLGRFAQILTELQKTVESNRNKKEIVQVKKEPEQARRQGEKIDSKLRRSIQKDIVNNVHPTEIAAKYNVSKATAYYYKNKLHGKNK